MIRTQRQLTKEQSQTLKAVAAELQSSVAALVRESIADLPIQTAAVTFPTP